jgi:hypothetical protein
VIPGIYLRRHVGVTDGKEMFVQGLDYWIKKRRNGIIEL